MLFFDLEVNYKTKVIEDIGAITIGTNEFHSSDVQEFMTFINNNSPQYFAGHNIVAFDMEYINKTGIKKLITKDNIIDTLYLSTLFFPKKPYHNLVKDDKLNVDYTNNPLNDSIKAKSVFLDCVNTFERLDNDYKQIIYFLLRDVVGVKPFFAYLKYAPNVSNFSKLLKKSFNKKICFNKDISKLVEDSPLEFAFALNYINTNDTHQSLLPAWVLKTFSKVEDILMILRNTPCNQFFCSYCKERLSPINALRRYFNYQSFKDFNGVKLQENTVVSALNGESLIAIFPTGGGKSLTFQLPALIAGENMGGLTVVISPLQSLMKDQVDNLLNRNITKAAYINGLLTQLERYEMIKKVADGSVSLLYLSPEALRNKTIYKLLLNRQVVRFVIDEAHCFSTWGHDFRPDYLYIGDFIKQLSDDKQLTKPIPISCFTATAKYDVVKDIKNYFYKKLKTTLKEFITTQGRTNLQYRVIKINSDNERYFTLRNLLEANQSPTIIYASKTNVIDDLFLRLRNDGFEVSKFHGKMNQDEKIVHQNDFMEAKTSIMVATNAFGMGVDKDDVGLVIHYQISNSLENYVQEAGRAGRSENLMAKCYILYDENDLNDHLQLLNSSKVSIKEISQVWTGIKKELKPSEQFSRTTKEIGKIAGWEDFVYDIDTKIKTSILALEDVNFIKRKFNSPRVYATSLRVNNFHEAQIIINNSSIIPSDEKIITKRIISTLISQKRRSNGEDRGESRVDYLADNLGVDKYQVIQHINYLRELHILADDNDLVVKLDHEIKTYKTKLNRYNKIFEFLLNTFDTRKRVFNLKELNEQCPSKYKTNYKNIRDAVNLLDFLKIINLEKGYNNYIEVELLENKSQVFQRLKYYLDICYFIINYLYDKLSSEQTSQKLVYFSLLELKNKYIHHLGMINKNIQNQDIETTILILHRLDIIKPEGGFLVCYLPLTIERIEENNVQRYTKKEYEKMANHYEIKNQHIHIVGRYAELMAVDEERANKFVSDYFNLEYRDFLDKHFPGQRKKDLDLKMTRSRYQKLFGNLSLEQLDIINNDKEKIIGVAAGPGSGKTTLLVHKLVSIIYNEDVRTDQLLMLTFSRGAAIEFKERLKELIGSVANYINITTFHSFAFDLLGKLGSIEASTNIIQEAVELIRQNEADNFKMTRMVLVIDEAQDISEDEYNLIQELIKFNDDLRVIAVGDDDQNIYEFRGSNSKYLKEFASYKKYELTTNYRSKHNIVQYANKFISQNQNRLKTHEIKSYTQENGFVEVVFYQRDNIIMGLLDKVLSKPTEKTAILTRTNEEAQLISGVLNDRKINNRLIQDNREVKPLNIYELRAFYEMILQKTSIKIDYDIWHSAMSEFKNRFEKSLFYQEYELLLNKFFELYKEPYVSDLKEYLLEVDSSYFSQNEKLIIANLHKVKGMQFDNVYLLYNFTNKIDEEKIRTLYVGMTRAKNYLSIHTNNPIFKNIIVEDVQYQEDNNKYSEPEVVEMICSLRNVNLGVYNYLSSNLQGVLPGDNLFLNNKIFRHRRNNVGELSKAGFEKVSEWQSRGYYISSVEVYNLVYWFNKEKEEEVLVMLPKIKFKRIGK